MLKVYFEISQVSNFRQLNYNFTEIITYFLYEFFENRLKDDREFQAIKECLKEYEENSI